MTGFIKRPFELNFLKKKLIMNFKPKHRDRFRLFVKLLTAFSVAFWPTVSLTFEIDELRGSPLIKVVKIITPEDDSAENVLLIDEHNGCFIYNTEQDFITSRCKKEEVHHASDILSDYENCHEQATHLTWKDSLMVGGIVMGGVSSGTGIFALGYGQGRFEVKNGRTVWYLNRPGVRFLYLGMTLIILAITGGVMLNSSRAEAKSACEETHGSHLYLLSEPILFLDPTV